MPRFVILKHDHPHLHWDLMFEAGSHLRSWRLRAVPETDLEVIAEPSFDHRLFYLDYEGEVSGGRGQVSRVESGTFTWLVDEPELVVVEVKGQRLQGQLFLSKRSTGEWTCRVEPPTVQT